MNSASRDVSIRLCRPNDRRDFAEIDRLERECAQGTLLRFYFASDDPKNPLPRAMKYPNHIVTVAENSRGKMVGTVSGVIRTVRFADGRFEKVGWLFSLRVGCDQRRMGIASKLVVDMEQRMREEHGVKFIFDSMALDNMASVRLFEKLGYSYMFTAKFYGINISHTNKMLDKQHPVHGSRLKFNVTRLDLKQSKSFIHKHFSKSFLYPEDSSTVLDSNTYVACSGENLVAINVWKNGDKMGILSIPIYLRLLYYVMIILSFLFPNFFEKPLPLSRPWMMRFAYPILVDCNIRAEKAVPRDLFYAAVTHAVRDLKNDGADVLMIPLEKGVTSLNETQYNLVRKCSFVSPLMRGNGGMVEIGKSTAAAEQNDEDNDELLAMARKSQFWFFNGAI